MQQLVNALDIVAILQIGSVGLGFLLALMAYRLLANEMAREEVRNLVLASVGGFMVFSVVLCGIGLLSQLIGGDRGILPIAAEAPDGVASAELSGLVLVTDHDAQLGKVNEFIGRAKKSLWMSGTHFQITLYNQLDSLAEAILRGVTVRILMFDPTSTAMEEFSPTLRHSGRGLSQEICAAIANVDVLNDRVDMKLSLPENKGITSLGRVEAKLYRQVPQGRMYLVDPELGQAGEVLYVPYINLQLDTNAPALLLTAEEPAGATYVSATQNHWREALDLSEWQRESGCAALPAS